MTTSKEVLEQRIEAMKQEGVVDIKLHPVSNEVSDEEVAKSVLDLLDAEVVEDKEMF